MTSGNPTNPNMALMYGGVPPNDESPRITPDATAPAPIPALGLLPCPNCQRHIHVGTVCPFCFATTLAAANKPPTRTAVDQALKDANATLAATDNALASLRAARERLCTVIRALEEARK
jgi:hypothetical protein